MDCYVSDYFLVLYSMQILLPMEKALLTVCRAKVS